MARRVGGAEDGGWHDNVQVWRGRQPLVRTALLLRPSHCFTDVCKVDHPLFAGLFFAVLFFLSVIYFYQKCFINNWSLRGHTS